MAEDETGVSKCNNRIWEEFWIIHNEMSRKCFLFIFFCFTTLSTYCQNIIVDSIVINHIIEKEPASLIVEGFGEGPNIKGVLNISNHSNTPITVGNYLYLKYSFEGHVCKSLPFCYTPDNEKIIRSGDSLSISFQIPLLLGYHNNSLIKREVDSSRLFDSSTYIREITDSIFVCILLDGQIIYACPEKVEIDYGVYYLK